MFSVRVLYPRYALGNVVIQCGEMITLSIEFSHKLSNKHISVDDANIPVPPWVQQTKPDNMLSFGMKLRNITAPDPIYLDATCDNDHHSSLTSATGVCGCIVYFAGQSFPIVDRKAKICFEFPIMAKGCDKERYYKYGDSYAFSSVVH